MQLRSIGEMLNKNLKIYIYIFINYLYIINYLNDWKSNCNEIDPFT